MQFAHSPTPATVEESSMRHDDHDEISPCRILAADDNVDAATSLGMMLRLMGHETRVVHDGLRAVEEAESFRPDVALLDIGMPKLNGYEAAQCIRRASWGKDIVLVALTGWGQDDDKRRALEAGFDHHFTKPVNLTDLQRLLRSLMCTSEVY
jgi:CheY-like chemotaxis protein